MHIAVMRTRGNWGGNGMVTPRENISGKIQKKCADVVEVGFKSLEKLERVTQDQIGQARRVIGKWRQKHFYRE